MNSASLVEKYADWSCIHMLDDDRRTILVNRELKAVPAAQWEVLNYHPNAWALVHLHTSGSRYTTLVTCRQCGKTEGIAADIWDAMTAPPQVGDKKVVWAGEPGNSEVLAFEPNYVGVISFDFDHAYKSVSRFIARVISAYGDDAIHMNKNDHILTLKKNGAVLRWFSGENPLSVQGETFTSLYIDEAQNVTDEVWNNVRPALDVRNARIVSVGTPDPVVSCSWFRGLYFRGLDPESPNYYSYTLPCWENEWASIETIADARSTMTDSEFRKKYLGQWVDDEGVVFRNVDANVSGHFLDATDAGSGPFVLGLDLAKSDDFTVAYVVDRRTQRIVARLRFNRLDYTKVADKVEELYRQYHVAGISMDTTGLGEPVADMLRKKGLTVWPFVFGAKSKEALVSNLARELERGKVGIPEDDKQLIRELKAYTRSVTKAGNVTYSAPVNFNDDCVMALGLALLRTRVVGIATSASYI